MESFKQSESELLGSTHTAADFFTHGQKGMLLLGMLLKASDISNPTRPSKVRHLNMRRQKQLFFMPIY